MLGTSGQNSEPATFSEEHAARIAANGYGIVGKAQRLVGDLANQNFLVTSEQGAFVLKIVPSSVPMDVLDLQNKALSHLATKNAAIACPRLCRTLSGEEIARARGPQGCDSLARMLTFVRGDILEAVGDESPAFLENLGRFFGHVDRALQDFAHPAMERALPWDVRRASDIGARLTYIEDAERIGLVEHFLDRFERLVEPRLSALRTSVIHNDGNPFNILCRGRCDDALQSFGLIDFGDMLRTCTVAEPAVVAAFTMLGRPDPITPATHLLRGYNEIFPLAPAELDVLFDLICIRLCISVSMSAYQRACEPHNDYLSISERAVWEALARLRRIDPVMVLGRFEAACDPPSGQRRDKKTILALRDRHLSKAMGVHYPQAPLKIVRGRAQYLYDEEGRAYLDCVNNVAHVGHCHPRVVEAAHRQMAVLNTNSRYLHDNLVAYAERLCAMLPDPLRVCFFVNSGSEANDLALRLARTHTRRQDVVVLDYAYHGQTSAVVEISPYKFDGPGGTGARPFVHKVPYPDGYRGTYRGYDAPVGQKYAEEVRRVLAEIEERGRRPTAFFSEALLSLHGQSLIPAGYLDAVYRSVRAAGGICIVDEVQTGFGRIGSHFWGFETQNVIPDIITLGKPIGNGYPLGAVVTTPEIGESFHNGMGYFNTFGGNTVACAVGLAVLDVIRDEALQARAAEVGGHLKAEIESLMERHPLIGAVRGSGLFLGVELVQDRESLEPATAAADEVVQRMLGHGIMLNTDGPHLNILKIKPPLPFSSQNASYLVETLHAVLTEMGH